MVKKIIAMTLALAMMFSINVGAKTFYDVTDTSEYGYAIDVLSDLGVLSGMGDGGFAPYNYLTRAQFAKIAVCILGRTEEAVETTDAFSDVKNTDWYSGYVNLVATEGIITGYPDGTFGANDYITYAQAVTVLVRILGYDASDVGYKWPQGYIDKANVLGLTEGFNISSNSPITRQDAALLIYRALFTDMKNTDSNLVTKMKKNVYEDAVIIATKKEDVTLLSNQVQTDKGTFKYKSDMDFSALIGHEGTFLVNDEDEIIVFEPSEDVTGVEYTISAVYTEEGADSVSLVMETGETVEIKNKTVVYMGDSTYTASKLAEGINSGSKIVLFIENDNIKRAVVDEYKYEGPRTIKAKESIEDIFEIADMATLKVIRKGLLASTSDLSEHDVVYYSEKTNTVYAYADRVTGVYEDAYPMKSVVTEVTVSGNKYKLATKTAINKLNESEGAFKIGDRVTLLFGESGDVVDVVSLTEDHVSNYGVVTGFSKEISEDEDTKGRTVYYVTVMSTDGTETKHLVKDDEYEDNIGDFCSIDFEDTYAVLSFPQKVVETGLILKDKKTLGTFKFANDYAIMEYCDGNSTKAVVSTLTLADVDNITLTKNDVIHVQKNNMGEITVLYLDNVSGNKNKYGVIISVPTGTKTGTYTLLSGTEEYSQSGTYTSFSKGDCVLYYQGLNGTDIEPMKKIGEGIKISNYVDNVIYMNGKSYIMADDVTVYAGRNTTELKTISLDDAMSLTGDITFHSDRSLASGGRVRVIRIFTSY
ncbi:MAG: S-layer homology domain-containing protein [Clostridia bacterium]